MNGFSNIILLGCLLSLCHIQMAEPRKRGRDRLPIKDEAEANARQEDKRKKASECRFGDQTYELEQTWHPDLGPPFGIMYCVHCECVPIHKKRRIIGRVQCKNIKTQCPKVTCPDPILLPGRCCKVCPGSEDQNPDLAIEVDLKREEEEKNGRHYAALLTRPTSSLAASNAASATGRLYFRKKALSYSFVTSGQFGKAKLLTFLDADGNIIEEFPLQPSHFQEETMKICGTWQRLPKRYRKQLRRDEMHAQLTNENGDVIAGKVAKHFGLRSELFSALITGSTGAGTAIVSLDSQTGSVHVNLLLSAMFEEDGEKNVHVEVKFECSHEGETRSITEDLTIPKVNNALTTVDFTTVIGEEEMSALGQGHLSITVRPKKAFFNQISGLMVPRFSCDIFDSVLSPLTEDQESLTHAQPIMPEQQHMSNARGLAWMQIDSTGLIKYYLKLHDLSGELISIQIDNGRKSQRLLRIVHEMTQDYAGNANGGWANGTFRMSAKDVDAFYHANLYVNVATEKNDRELRGRLLQNFLGTAQEYSKTPILLRGNPPNRTVVSGLAWVNVDSTCRFYYQVRLHGINRDSESKLVLKDHPMRNLKALNLVPGRQLDLQEFSGMEATGHQDAIHKLTMARMDSGDASLSVMGSDYVIEGRIEDVRAPQECKPRFSRNDLEMMPGFLSDLGEEKPGADKVFANKCFYEGQLKEDGSQWKATHEACKMCSCQRGKVVCDPFLCPKPECEKPFLPEGECCAVCDLNSTIHARGCHLEGDHVLHPPGSRWHPYIPPFGFSRCATCTCKSDTLEVECQSQKCPRLDCPVEQQLRPDALACCQICIQTTTPDPTQVAEEQKNKAPQTMAKEVTDDEILAQGGCKWKDEVMENGQTWNPRVLPFGEVQCVSCACKDGNANCVRKQCKALTCKYKISEQTSCCPRCALNRAETKKAKKILRIHKLKQIRRLRRLKHQQQQHQVEDPEESVEEGAEEPEEDELL